jgi:hypothetical protein
MSVRGEQDPRLERRLSEDELAAKQVGNSLRARHGATTWLPGHTPGKKCVKTPQRDGDPLRWRTAEDGDRHDPRNRTDGEGRR